MKKFSTYNLSNNSNLSITYNPILLNLENQLEIELDKKKFLAPIFEVSSKRILDLFIAINCLIILSPLFLIIALSVKLTSKGPIIYKQERVGYRGLKFNIYKFRTMKVDAEKHSGPTWAKKKDNRLTSIGNILRKSHLDELPQLINIFKGEMSVVGPRPERPFFINMFENEILEYNKRLLTKPGITGLAQVCHKYDETIKDVKKKIKYDILYIKKQSVLLDLKILYWTIGIMLTGKGAH